MAFYFEFRKRPAFLDSFSLRNLDFQRTPAARGNAGPPMAWQSGLPSALPSGGPDR